MKFISLLSLAAFRSGRTVARSGLRMMPTFPLSPLSSVQQVFPSTAERLACQTAPSQPSRWLSLHPAYSAVRLLCFRPSCIGPTPRAPAQSREGWAKDAPPREEFPLLPQWPSLRSGFCCPSPSTLIRPHAPHSWAHRSFAAERFICDAFAVQVRLGNPRAVPCFR